MTMHVQDTQKLTAKVREALLGAGLPEALAGGQGNTGKSGFTAEPEPGPGPARAAVRWQENGRVTGGDVPSQGLRNCLRALRTAGIQAQHVPSLRRECLLAWQDER